MQPIEKLQQCPAAFAPLAAKINELVDVANLFIGMEGRAGIKITHSDGKIIIEVSGLGGELDCTTTPPTVNIYADS